MDSPEQTGPANLATMESQTGQNRQKSIYAIIPHIPIDITEFTIFSKLPAELRCAIWEAALPDEHEPHLSLYEKGKKPVIRYDMPLYFTNQEARSVVLAWMRTNTVSIQSIKSEDGQFQRTFVGPWNPLRDTVYVTSESWRDFVAEAEDAYYESKFTEGGFLSDDFTRLAIPKGSISGSIFLNTSAGEFYPEMYVVQDPQPVLVTTEEGQPLRWRYEDAHLGFFAYSDDCEHWEYTRGKNEISEDMHDTLEVLAKEAWWDMNGIPTDHAHEIRPINAVAY